MRRLVVLVAALVVVASACTVESGTGSSSSTDQPANDLLHDRGKAAAAIRAIERKVGASPAQLTTADVYDEYLIVDAQDPLTPDHIDRYTWRDGDVEGPEPVHLSGPQDETLAKLYPASSMRWSQLSAFVHEAEQQALRAKPIRIEQPNASYVDVSRSPSPDDDGRIIVRISIEGPRRSGYVEMTTTGDVRSVEVG